MFFLKKLFNSTLQLRSGQAILGLTIGIFLAGYAVFAFQAPTQAPPGGNVPGPVNVGAGDQVKLGGLAVDSLVVDGGIKTGGFTSLPSCNALTEGTLVFNKNINKISLCTNSTWEVFSTGADFDEDGFIAGVDCNDGDAAKWQKLPGYRDVDGDGYGAGDLLQICSGSSLPAGFVTNNSDCYDANANAYPGQTSWFSSHRGDGSFDYNCDVDQNLRWPQLASCGGCWGGGADAGWTFDFVPACGSGSYFQEAVCHPAHLDGECDMNYRNPRTQECR